jgi:hypothetical protein
MILSFLNAGAVVFGVIASVETRVVVLNAFASTFCLLLEGLERLDKRK